MTNNLQNSDDVRRPRHAASNASRRAVSAAYSPEAKTPESPLDATADVNQFDALKSGESYRARSQQDRHRRRVRTKAIIVGALVLAIALGVFVVWSLIQQGRANLLTISNAQIETQKEAVVLDDGKTLTYKGHKYRLNENMVTLCVLGRDREKNASIQDENFNGQADLVMVLAIDSSIGKMTAIVIPRDSMVDVEVNYFLTDELYKVERMQICLAYAYGTNDDSSSQLVARAASRALYNIPIDYYYTLNYDGVYELADVVGGVELTALETIPTTDIVEGEDIVLWGTDAQRYVQYRDISYEGSALDRQARQMQFMRALVSELLSTVKGNPTAVIEIYNTISDYATSNLTASEVSFLASVMANGSPTFETVSLKGESVVNDESEWEQFILDRDSVYQTILDVYYTQID